MKTILAGNANACLKNQINNMERKIHSTVNVLYPCNPDPMRALVLKSPRNCMHQEVMRMREMLIEVH